MVHRAAWTLVVAAAALSSVADAAGRKNVLHMVAVRAPHPAGTPPNWPPPTALRTLTRPPLWAKDDLRTELSLAYNHPEVSTPNLDALTKKSMVFQNAYCTPADRPSPIPSHSRAGAARG